MACLFSLPFKGDCHKVEPCVGSCESYTSWNCWLRVILVNDKLVRSSQMASLFSCTFSALAYALMRWGYWVILEAAQNRQEEDRESRKGPRRQPLLVRRWGGGVCCRVWAFWRLSHRLFWKVRRGEPHAVAHLGLHSPLKDTFRQPETQTYFLPSTFSCGAPLMVFK